MIADLDRPNGPHGWVIAGDSLPVMRALAPCLAKRVDLILIDPPYNTGRQFIYDDRFTSNQAWLDMIAVRLLAARPMLADDGAILVHIDEHQAAGLKALLDRIFGAANDLGAIVWDKLNPKGDAGHVACQHELIFAYARDALVFRKRRRLHRIKPNAHRMLNKAAKLVAQLGQPSLPNDLAKVIRDYQLAIDPAHYRRPYTLEQARRDYRQWLSGQVVSAGEAAYRHLDDDGRIYRTVSMAWPNKKTAADAYFEPLLHPRTGLACPVPRRGWRNPPATMQRLLAENRIVFGESEAKQPERKYFLNENPSENLTSVLRFGGSDDARLRELGVPFDNPKPVALIHQLIDAFVGGEGLVLDFFAGSGSVGHACLEGCAKGRGLRFVMIQSAEPLHAENAAQRNGAKFCEQLGLPPVLSAITRERIRRVAQALEAQSGFAARVDYLGYD